MDPQKCQRSGRYTRRREFGRSRSPEDEDCVEIRADEAISNHSLVGAFFRGPSFRERLGSSFFVQSTLDFCHAFDLSSRVPNSVVEDAIHSGRLTLISPRQPSGSKGTAATSQILSQIATLLLPGEVGSSTPQPPFRICIPSLGSPHWGEFTDQVACPPCAQLSLNNLYYRIS